MTRITKAFVGAKIHDGRKLYADHALVVGKGDLLSVRPKGSLPQGCPTHVLKGGIIMPGFVDLQVNGGGGVMFNDDQSVRALRTIAQAHQATGTAALLPTLITDTIERTREAIDAVEQAIADGVGGIVGIHLEGPHLSVARKGAHDPNLIRTMTDEDLAILQDAADRLPNVMVTLAPENATSDQIKILSDAGIVVSLGHTDADFATCMGAFDAGARCVTHLFNAMSQMGNREPGLVGATLVRDDICAGLIADGIHVHPATIRAALAACDHFERIFLVTDAMATAGSSIQRFSINGRDVFRKDQRLTLADGTLAGADLEMPRAIAVMRDQVGDSETLAMRRATSAPTALLREPGQFGRLAKGLETVVHCNDDFTSISRLHMKDPALA